MDLSTKKTASNVEDKTEVNSANSWETADLGDEGRNNKFLRLMGAKKKEHHGRFVIGDQEASAHKRQKDDEKVIAEGLVDQYEQGMEHRLVGGKKGHLGLGYHPELSDEEEAADEFAKEADAAEKEASAAEKEADVAADEDKKEAADQERSEGDGAENDGGERTHKKDERKREGGEDESDHDKKKMKFVESTS